MDKRIDILLSQADFFKLATIGLYTVALLELIEKGFVENGHPDQYKLQGGFWLGSACLVAMVVCWAKAKKLTRK